MQGARTILGLLRTTSADSSLALASLTPPHLIADARLLLIKPRLDLLKLTTTHAHLPAIHYSPSDHLNYLTRLIQFPEAKTRSRRYVQRHLPPPPLPTDHRSLRRSVAAFTDYRTLKEWNISTHGHTLHTIKYNPISWRHWFKTLDRRSVTSLSRFLSDHFPTRAYLHRFGLTEDNTCRFCSNMPETSLHLLTSCPKISTDTLLHQTILDPFTPSCPSQELLQKLAIQIQDIEEKLRSLD